MIFNPVVNDGGGGGSFQVARGRSTSTTQIQIGFKPAVVMISICGAETNSVVKDGIVFVRPIESDSYSFQYSSPWGTQTGTVTFTDDGLQLSSLSLPLAGFYYWFAIG